MSLEIDPGILRTTELFEDLMFLCLMQLFTEFIMFWIPDEALYIYLQKWKLIHVSLKMFPPHENT